MNEFAALFIKKTKQNQRHLTVRWAGVVTRSSTYITFGNKFFYMKQKVDFYPFLTLNNFEKSNHDFLLKTEFTLIITNQNK